MIRLFAFFSVFLFLAGTASAACLSQGEARSVVASGKAKPLAAVQSQAGGEIVKAQLCQEGGGYVYRLSVLVNGKVTTKVVSAN